MNPAHNQCMGCQAKWPLVACRLNPALQLHKVEGGYRGEVVACTKDRYQ